MSNKSLSNADIDSGIQANDTLELDYMAYSENMCNIVCVSVSNINGLDCQLVHSQMAQN